MFPPGWPSNLLFKPSWRRSWFGKRETYRKRRGALAGVARVHVLEHLERLVRLTALQKELGTLREEEQPETNQHAGNGARGHEQVPAGELEPVGDELEVHRNYYPGYACKTGAQVSLRGGSSRWSLQKEKSDNVEA